MLDNEKLELALYLMDDRQVDKFEEICNIIEENKEAGKIIDIYEVAETLNG